MAARRGKQQAASQASSPKHERLGSTTDAQQELQSSRSHTSQVLSGNHPAHANSQHVKTVDLSTMEKHISSSKKKHLEDSDAHDTHSGEEVMNFYIRKNTVTKYAFATRVGFIPMNPGKVN